ASSKDGGLKVGDHFVLVDYLDDCERHPPSMSSPPDPPCTPTESARRTIPAVVTGLIAPNDVNDPWWPQNPTMYFSGQPPYDGAPIGAAILVPAASMDGAFGALFPN